MEMRGREHLAFRFLDLLDRAVHRRFGGRVILGHAHPMYYLALARAPHFAQKPGARPEQARQGSAGWFSN